jgi:adenylate cyclase
MTTPEDLERAVLGSVADRTGDEVAVAAGLPREQTRRLWLALGFPDAGKEAAFSAADAQALERVGRILSETNLDVDTVVRMTRAVGQTMDRLADWEVATLNAHAERTNDVGERSAEVLRLAQQVGPDFEALMAYAWRRHLVAALTRAGGVDGSPAEGEQVEATVGFADLVSFSALTNRLGDDEIGDLVERFESRAHEVVSRRAGRVVKTLGDSVLFWAQSPADGVDIAWDIVQVIGRDPRLPDVRLGVVTGSVVTRMGDVYGPAVNLAARLVTVARRNRVITDVHTAEGLPPERYETRALPVRPVRGFGELQPMSVRHTRRP